MGRQLPYLSLNVSELRYSRTTRGRGRWQGIEVWAVIGTLGLLLVAKKKGLLGAIGPIVLRMEALGMFVSVQLREAVLAAAAEPDR